MDDIPNDVRRKVLLAEVQRLRDKALSFAEGDEEDRAVAAVLSDAAASFEAMAARLA